MNETTPYRKILKPLRNLRVEVSAGPDKGKSASASSETLTVGSAAGNDLQLEDDTVSRFHLELSREEGRVIVLDCGSKNGSFVGQTRVYRASVPVDTRITLGRTEIWVRDGEAATMTAHGDTQLGRLHGRSMHMRKLMARILKAAQSDVSVLLVGESGTGKELIAEALHEEGARSAKPFVTVDCGALSPTLVASELFGHERGAFTGAASARKGAFERANGGTIFLDEIGELSPELQVNLLGVLERRRFRRLGGDEELSLDVRVICATNRDLRAEINSEKFRLDLFYRIAVVQLRIPALRERSEDLPLLIEHFLRECGFSGDRSAVFSDEKVQELASHFWPGNVRELRNLVEATVAMGEAPDLMKEAPRGSTGEIRRVLGRPYKEARATLLQEFERQYCTELYERSGGNVSKAARDSQMDRSHLTTLLRRHGLK